jgi:hypothetical protein
MAISGKNVRWICVAAMLSLIGGILPGCCNAIPTSEPGSKRQFRQYTLLSWRAGGQWRFSLREGERVDKSIQAEGRSAIIGTAALKAQLRRLPHGAYVNWDKYRAIGFEYPPVRDIEEIQSYAKQIHIYLFFNFLMEE